jgi:hypothetical protein
MFRLLHLTDLRCGCCASAGNEELHQAGKGIDYQYPEY